MTNKEILVSEDSPAHIRIGTTLALIAMSMFVSISVPTIASANAPISYIKDSSDRFIDTINDRYGKHIDTVSMLTGMDRDMIVSVIAIESEGNAKATSPVGAKGLMQLMPETAADMGVKDRTDPFQNILGGTRYIQALENEYGFDNVNQALIAYNMGPSRAKRFLSQYDETDHAYVKRVRIVYNRIQERKQEDAKTALLHIDNDAAASIAPRPTVLSSMLSAISLRPKFAEAATSK